MAYPGWNNIIFQTQPQQRDAIASTTMSKPKNWPAGIPYLSAPLHGKDITAVHLTALRAKPASSAVSIVPVASTSLPAPLVRIQGISDPSHPANGQHGLFATRDLKPGTFILPYLGRVHTSKTTDPLSDYDLWLDKEQDLAVDAASCGNEGRFVNDYRGVRARANAEFGVAWCERWGQLCVGFWVLGGGKKHGEGIKKGEEICVSYGKGFWDKRSAEGEAAGRSEQ